MHSPETSTSVIEKEPAFKPGEVVFIPRSKNRICSAVITGISDDGAIVVWEEDNKSGKKLVPLEDLVKLSPESVRATYAEGAVVNIPRGEGGKSRSNITIAKSALVDEGKVAISWMENGQESTKIFEAHQIQVASEAKPEIVAPVDISESIPSEHLDAIKIDFKNAEQRRDFVAYVKNKVTQAQESAKSHLPKFNLATDSALQELWKDKETFVPRRDGLQAANNARIFFTGQLAAQMKRLESAMSDPSNRIDIKTQEDGILRTLVLIESQISIVNKAVAAVTTENNPVIQIEDILSEVESPIIQVSEIESVQLAENTVSPVESIEQSNTAVEKIDISVEDVSGLPYQKQIDVYVAKVKEVSRQVNERLAKFGPGHIDAEQRQKLVDIHDRLVRLSERLEERLYQTDQNLVKKQVPQTIKWVNEDLRLIQNLVAEAEASVPTEPVPAVAVIPESGVLAPTVEAPAVPVAELEILSQTEAVSDTPSNEHSDSTPESSILSAEKSSAAVADGEPITAAELVPQRLEKLVLTQSDRVSRTEKVADALELDPLMSADEVIALIESSLVQFDGMPAETLTKEQQNFVTQITRFKKELAGRKVVRRVLERGVVTPGLAKEIANIEKADKLDIVRVTHLLDTFSVAPSAEPVLSETATADSLEVEPVSSEVISSNDPVVESAPLPEAALESVVTEAVPAAIEYLRSLPYLTPSERTTGQSMYENYLHWKQEGRSAADLERLLANIQAYADDLVEHPDPAKLQERLAAVKAEISSTNIPGRDTETILTLIENVERITAEESASSNDHPRTIAAYKTLVTYIADDAARVRAEKAALPNAGQYETPQQVMARAESIPVGIGSVELVKAKNAYRDALVYSIKVNSLQKNNKAFADADRYENFTKSAREDMLVAKEAYESLLWDARSQFGNAASAQPATEIVALEAELNNETKRKSRLKRVIGALALGLGIFAAEEVADGTRKVESIPAPAPYTASEISVAPTMEALKPTPNLVVVKPTSESAPKATAPAFDAAYPPLEQSRVEGALTFGDTVSGTVEVAPQAQVDRWGSMPVEKTAPSTEAIPPLVTHNFTKGEGLIKIGRGVTEVGALSVMEHVPVKQRESVIDLTVARIANSPSLQDELNVGVDRVTDDVFIYSGRALNLTAFERELSITAKAVGVYVESGEKTSAAIPPRPTTVEVVPVAGNATESGVTNVEEAQPVSLTDLREYVQNFDGGPAGLGDAVAKWVKSVEGAYFIAPGNRLLSIFTNAEYLDPYKALANKTVSEILNLQGNKNTLARSQAINEWRITGEGFAQWADKLEKFVRHYDVRGASDLTLEKAAELMYADAELSKTTNTTL